MNVIKKLWRFFAKNKGTTAVEDTLKEKNVASKTEEEHTDRVREVMYLLSMERNVVHPADLMQPLCMAMAWHTKKPAAVSIQDIRLYTVYDKKDASFLGSFYAIENEGMFFGNIVGNSHIIVCKTDAFRFEETDELFAPLKNDGKNVFVLMCRYKRTKARLTVKGLKKFDFTMKNGEIVREFSDKTSFDEAYCVCQKLID